MNHNDDALLEVSKDNVPVSTTESFKIFLESVGLPTNNIIANDFERNIITANIKNYLQTLSEEEKQNARYLSKFVGASAIGLFDAALNYIWNEVVLNLRKKAILYGIDLFFDAAVGGQIRNEYKEEKDLEGLKDRVLLDTCKKLELLSDVVYKKLSYILTMRNEVAASHPSVESIGAYELLGWVQTCVKDVLQDKPSESALKIKAFIENIKNTGEELDSIVVEKLNQEIEKLSTPHVNNLLIRIFGMYVDEKNPQVLRVNLSKISPKVWSFSEEKVKYNIGIQVKKFEINLNNSKRKFSLEFLKIVDGNRYKTKQAKHLELNDLCDKLEDARTGYDNYWNEPSIIQDILSYLNTSLDIPKAISEKMIQTILLCRIGKGISYQEGVSPQARPLYDKFFKLLDDDMIIQLIKMSFKTIIRVKIDFSDISLKQYSEILDILYSVASLPKVKEIVKFLRTNIKNATNACNNPEFKELLSPYINK